MTALYIHWPFCASKCPYCDFNSHVREKVSFDAWQKAYLTEIAYYHNYLSQNPITSIFFGGGTPSLMQPETVEAIISTARPYFKKNIPIEITLEANPSSIEAEKFSAFKKAGINRVSLGIQSLIPADLKFLGRGHSVEEAKEAMIIAKEIFANYSFDFIYARPHQTIEAWKEELEDILSHAGSHLSLYQLTIEKGTVFYNLHRQKTFIMPNENTSFELYDYTYKRLKKNGLLLYEVSNYAKKGHESQHNLTYWRYGDYLGIGPGAHSRITCEKTRKKQAMMAFHMPEKWLHSVETSQHGTQDKQILDVQIAKKEALLMGLRVKEGICFSNWKNLFHEDFLSLFSQNTLDTLAKEKLIKISTTHFAPTYKGICVLNSVTNMLINAMDEKKLVEARIRDCFN